MARGGSRPGAGRPRLSEEEKAARAAARKAAAKGKSKPAAKKKAPAGKRVSPKSAAPAAHAPTGIKADDAPAQWPFGTRPPTPPAPPAKPSELSPLDYLLSIVRDDEADLKVRMQAAALAAPFVHAKPAPQGKKDGKADAAKSAGAGKFAAAAPPLKLVKR
jgi:phage terminase small subunit